MSGVAPADSVAGMSYYTVTLRRPRRGWTSLKDIGNRARRVSEEMQQEGRRVRFLRSVFVPEDEASLCVYEAGSARDVREAALCAGLTLHQLTNAIHVQDEGSPR